MASQANAPAVEGPLILLPSQLFAARGRQAPEKQLMIAVLLNAVDCLEKYRSATRHPGRRLFQEVNRWFLANEADWPYSFECICGALDLDSDAIRERLRVAPARQAERVRSVARLHR